MAITANMTTHDGIALTDVYVRVVQAYVKNMPDDDGNDAWKLIYDVLIYKDKADAILKKHDIKLLN